MALYGCPLSVTERVERRRAAAFSQRDSRPRLTSTISSASEASCSAASSFKIYKTTQTRSWRQMKHAAFIASKLCPLAIIRIISDTVVVPERVVHYDWPRVEGRLVVRRDLLSNGAARPY